MNELKNELRIELNCGRCGLTKVITVNLDADGVFTIPNKYCPNDLNMLSRDVLRQYISEPKLASAQSEDEKLQAGADKNAIKEPDESTKNKAGTSNAVPRPTGILEVPKHGANRPKKT